MLLAYTADQVVATCSRKGLPVVSEEELEKIIEDETECDFNLVELAIEMTGGEFLSFAIDGEVYDEDFSIPGDVKGSGYFLHVEYDPDGGTDVSCTLYHGNDFYGCMDIYDKELPCVVGIDDETPNGSVHIIEPEWDNWGDFTCDREIAKKCLIPQSY